MEIPYHHMMVHLHFLKGLNNFFTEKIENIKMYWKSQSSSSAIDPLQFDYRTTTPPLPFTKFQFLSQIDTKKLIKAAPIKSYELDPIANYPP